MRLRLEDGHRSATGVRLLPGLKDGYDEMPRLAVEDQKGMVDVPREVTVVVTLFLVAVGAVCSGIEVEQYLFRSAVLAVLCGVGLHQSAGHSVAGTGRGRVFHPADGGLRGQIRAGLR
jgi:hypothetical protein